MKAWLLAAALGTTLATFAQGQTPRFLVFNPWGPLRIYDFETDDVHELPARMHTNPSLTSDGQIVAADGTGGILLYRWQRPGRGFIELPGLSGFGGGDPALSGTGQFIAFTSFEIDNENVRLYDAISQRRIQTRGLNTDAFDEFYPTISADGRWIAFTSDRNGPPGALCENKGGCGNWDVFLYDRAIGALVDLPGLNSTGEPDQWPSISADGRFIVFATVRASHRFKRSVFLYDRETQTIDDLPKMNGPPDLDRRFRHFMPSISDDGRYIAFSKQRPSGPVSVFDRLTDALVPTPGLQSSGAEPWIE